MTLLKNEITKQERKQGRGAIIDYCQKKRERYNYTFTYEGETGLKYYTVHGVKTTEQEFNRLLPIDSIQHHRENIDPTHI